MLKHDEGPGFEKISTLRKVSDAGSRGISATRANDPKHVFVVELFAGLCSIGA